MNREDRKNVFLLIGQSNMAGRGRLGEVAEIKHPEVFMFRDGCWCQAVEPLHTDNVAIAGVGLAMSFAVTLIEKISLAPIGLVPCAVGGTPLARWMPGNDLYETAVSAARAALECGNLRGILWHQGENDSRDPDNTASYAQRFCEMIQTLRSELKAPNVPVIAGQLGPFLYQREEFSGYESINRQLQELRGTISRYDVVSAEGLTDKGDHLHFDSASLREFGLRYADAFIRVVSQ